MISLRFALDRAEMITRAGMGESVTINVGTVDVTEFAAGRVVFEPEHIAGERGYLYAPDPAHVLRTLAAHRKLLDLHSRVDARPGWNLGIAVAACAGCGASFDEEYMVADVNDCPVVLAVASIYFPESDG